MAETQSQLKQHLGRALCDQCVAIRDRRRVIEAKWLHSRRVWMDADTERRYIPETGRQNRIPSARRVGERTVTRCTEMVMPNAAKNFDIQPTVASSQQNLTNVDAYMRHVYKRRIPTRSIVSQLVRCTLLYGRPILKTSVRVYNKKVWPTQRVVDPFAFYIFPETAATFEEAEVIFEDYLYSYERYSALSRKYSWLDPLETSELTKPDWPYHLTERLAYQGITDPTQNVANLIQRTSDELRRTTTAFVSLTELWLRREDRLYQVYIAWNLYKGPRIVGFIRSDYDEPLYRTVNHRPLPGEAYTNAQMEDIVGLEILQNDQLNKFQDAVDWEQGFVASAAGQRHDSWRMRGRALWLTQDDPRQQLNFIQPPVTSTNQLRAWQIYLSLMNSMGGAGTIAEGQPGRNMPRAGFAMNTLVNLGMADIQDIAKLIEAEVLTPGLADVYKVTQFIPDDQLLMIPGAAVALENGQETSVLKKADLLGSYEFEWIGSVQYQDEGTRAQRVLIFLNMLSQPGFLQILQQQGYIPDLVELTKITWRYVLGERGLTEILKPLPVMQQQVMQTQQERPASSAGGAGALQYRLPSMTNGFIQQ